jgi:hypothetical protein
MPRIPEGKPDGPILEIPLDDLIRMNLRDASVVFDRAAAAALVQELLGTQEPLESILLIDLLEAAPRVRVTWKGISADLGQPMMIVLAQRVVGRDVPVRKIRVGDLLAALPDVTLDDSGTPSIAGAEELGLELGRTLARAESFERARGAKFLERRDLELQYAAVTALVGQLEREGLAAVGPEALHEEALGRLFDSGRAEAVPLLEARWLLEQEMAEADLRSMTLSERIAFRSEARRRAFGKEEAEALFGREEAIEQYRIDLLAMQDDLSLSEADREAWIVERRQALKIELAALGSYVGFVGEDRAEVDATLRERLGDEFDLLDGAQLEEARRQVYLERLPADLRQEVESRGAAAPVQPATRGRERS